MSLLFASYYVEELAAPHSNKELLTFFVMFLFVVLHHRARSNFFGTIPIAAALLSRFFYVFIHALLFVANALHMFFLWHLLYPPYVLVG
jgi:hypothetical protein